MISINRLAWTHLKPKVLTWACFAIGCIVGMHIAIAISVSLADSFKPLAGSPEWMVVFYIGYSSTIILTSLAIRRLRSNVLEKFDPTPLSRLLSGCVFSVAFYLLIFPIQRYLMDYQNLLTSYLAGPNLNTTTFTLAFGFGLLISTEFEAFVTRITVRTSLGG